MSALLALSLALAGCGKPGQDPAAAGPDGPAGAPAELTAADEAALVARVEGKWRAMERHDFGTAYEYTTPKYREVFPKYMYLNKFGYDVSWELTGVDVLAYDAQAAVASVAVRVMSESTKQTALAASVGTMTDTVNEKWFFIDGEWWNSAK